MTTPATPSRPIVNMLVCETGDRWRRAIAVSQTNSTKLSFELVTRLATAGEIRALAIRVRPLIVLWELPLPTSESTHANSPQLTDQLENSVQWIDSQRDSLHAFQIVGRAKSPPLLLAALPSTNSIATQQLHTLTFAARQLGASQLLEGPEHFPLAWRLINRYIHRSLPHLERTTNSPTVNHSSDH